MKLVESLTNLVHYPVELLVVSIFIVFLVIVVLPPHLKDVCSKWKQRRYSEESSGSFWATLEILQDHLLLVMLVLLLILAGVTIMLLCHP